MKRNDKMKRWIRSFFVLIITLLWIALPMHLYAQQEGVVLKFEKAPLITILKYLEKNYGYDFVYKTDDVSKVKAVTIVEEGASFSQVMDSCLKGSGLVYAIQGKSVLIRKAVQGNEQRICIIQGRVTDEKNNPLPGVTVRVVSSEDADIIIGTATDANGNYQLKLPPPFGSVGCYIRYSFVGMVSETVVYLGGDETIYVVLKEDSKVMSDIIVTGYQQIEKRQLTSAVSTLKTEDIHMVGSASIEQMLQGQLPGLFVVNTSAGPGASPKIRVRGTATISGNADPLWVLDGVILENSIPISAVELNDPNVMNMFNSAIGGISPTDIESITVLKDASATAIYGTRAANGVIVVTTKKGRRNFSSSSYQHTSSITFRPSYNNFNLLNSKERVELDQQLIDDGVDNLSGGTGVGLLHALRLYMGGIISKTEMEKEVQAMEHRNTDWFKILFRHAYTQTHNLSFSGGSDRADYYVSLSYRQEQGSDKLSQYEQIGGLIKINTELFKGVKLGTILQVDRRDRDSYFSSIDPFRYAVTTSRTVPLDENGNYFFYHPSGGNDQFNILHEQKHTGKESRQTDLKAIANLSVDLMEGLKYNGLFSYASSHSSTTDYATEQSNYIAGIRGYSYGNGTTELEETSPLPFGGVYNETNYEQRTSLIRNGLEYRNVFFEGLSVDGMVGQEFRTTAYKGLTTNAWGYMRDRGNIFYNPGASETIRRNDAIRTLPTRSNISYYGVLSGMYKQRYIINGNIRFDGSNLFGSNPKYRYLPLWSVSGKWIASEEELFAKSKWVNHLAFRASYGLRGNIVEDSSPQIISSALPPDQFTQLLKMEILQAPNPELKWETTYSVNVGLEVGMFNGRFSLDMDYYRDFSRDLIAYKDVSAVTGFHRKYVNYADVKNQGIDIVMTGKIIQKNRLSWTSSLNLGYVKNRVEKSYIAPQAKNLVKSTYTPGEVREGRAINGMFSYRFAGLSDEGLALYYNAAEEKVSSANPEEIANQIYSDVDNLKYEGTRDPMLSGGFMNMFRYKQLTLSIHFAFGLKSVVRLPNVAYNYIPEGHINTNKSILERWRFPGDEATKEIPRLTRSGFVNVNNVSIYANELYNMSTRTVIPGDYLRLRNVMLEYRLPVEWTEKVVLGERSLGGVSIKIQAQNLFVWADSRLKGYDPETINYSTTGYGSLPLQQNITFGLNVNF